MIYPIVLYGDPVLKKKALDLVPETVNLIELVEDMFATMKGANGVGLAAPQIGKSIRLFVMDSSPMKEEGVRQVFVNPIMIEESGEDWAFEEGCLSIPGIREDVLRPSHIKITFWDEHWKKQTKAFDGLDARVIQHEYDHIEGVLFTDHITAFKKRLLKSKLTNISKGKIDAEYKVKMPAKR
ncbi:MAG: peptide deformylase [Flammeovirgaceae bacterium]|nr:peptide deformylase [Flammeovirgaceae bacterium]